MLLGSPRVQMSLALQNIVIIPAQLSWHISSPIDAARYNQVGKASSGPIKDTVKQSVSIISAQRASIRFVVCMKHYRCESEHVIQGWQIRRDRHVGKAYATNEAVRKDIVRNIEW
jgi:hypothetical protein